MKILSGYDDKHKTDYRAKVAEEVEQLRRKADLLREMLLGVTEGETIGQGDVFEVTPTNLRNVVLTLGFGYFDSWIETKVTEIN